MAVARRGRDDTVVGAGLLAPPLPSINSWKDEMGARMEGVADAALLDSEVGGGGGGGLDGELGQSSTGRRSPSGSGGRMGMEPKLGPSGGAGGWGRGPSGDDGEGGAREANEERIRSLQPAGSASSQLTARYCPPACLPRPSPLRPRVAAAVRRRRAEETDMWFSFFVPNRFAVGSARILRLHAS
uniref:Uncharacterized protein n=1 Tax=Oryza glumipatula TaxID=40148 RepID=A0A0D9YVR3_9ORYZ